MAIYKQIKLFLLIPFFLLMACHSVTQDELSGVGLSPDPIFKDTRTMVVVPINLPDNNDKADYVWLATSIETTVFNYLQFINGLPGNLENTIIENASDIYDFYGISKPNKAKKLEMLEKTLKDNKEHWDTITPEDKKQTLKRYTPPDYLRVNVIQGKDTAVKYLDEKDIVVQLTLSDQSILKMDIYDPVLGKSIVTWEIPLPKGINRSNDPEQTKVDQLLKEKLKTTIKKITKQKLAELTLPVISKDMSIFIDGKLILTPSIFLTQEQHQVYITQLGDIIQEGKIDIKQDGELNIDEAIKNQKGQKIVIKTNPNKTPIFIDEKYIGLTPINLTLPEGVHYIRASTLGYSHINYILKVDPYKPIKELSLDLQLNDQAYQKKVTMLRQLKLGTFFSGMLSFGAFLYAYERTGFYNNKITAGVDVENSSLRFKQFSVAQISFATLGGGLIITALVAQILEYQARDIGIGVGQDGNLGISYRF